MSEYLYLLRNEEGTAFKIGVSRDPRRRSVSLPQTIDFATSLQIAMNGGRAYKVERLLHYWFRDHAQAMPRGDGCTEWFGMDAWPAVLAFIEGERLRLGLGEPEPIPPPQQVAKSTRPSIDVEARRALIARNREHAFACMRRENYRTAYRVRKTLGELRGVADRDPVDGTPAIWILAEKKDNGFAESGHLYVWGRRDKVAKWLRMYEESIKAGEPDYWFGVRLESTSGHTHRGRPITTRVSTHLFGAFNAVYTGERGILQGSGIYRDLLKPDSGEESGIERRDGAELIRALLAPYIVWPDDPLHGSLLELHHMVNEELHRQLQEFARAWEEGSGGVWA